MRGSVGLRFGLAFARSLYMPTLREPEAPKGMTSKSRNLMRNAKTCLSPEALNRQEALNPKPLNRTPLHKPSSISKGSTRRRSRDLQNPGCLRFRAEVVGFEVRGIQLCNLRPSGARGLLQVHELGCEIWDFGKHL